MSAPHLASVLVVVTSLGGCAGTKQYVEKMNSDTFRVGVSECSGVDHDATEAALRSMRASVCGGIADIERIEITTVSPGMSGSTQCPGGWTKYENIVHCVKKKS